MASLNAYVVTFNCARNIINPSAFAPHLLQAASNNAPDLLVLCLQEIAPLGYAFLGGSFLTPYYNAFAAAVQLTNASYVNVITRNVGLTAIMLFAKDDVAANISSLETGCAGVGVQETGHKGGVGVRFMYDNTTLTFVSAHLAPAEDALERRNEDFRSIAERLVFVPEQKSPTQDERDEDAPLLQDSTRGTGARGIYSTSHLIFAGDLNYRTASRPPSEGDAATFPQPKADPKDPLHWSHLLKQDQLRKEVEAGRTLNGLHERPIKFPPTYKYRNKGEVTLDGDEAWKWAQHRWPSWCDRIFYSSTGLDPQTYEALPLFGTSDHRPVAMSVSIPVQPVSNLDEQSNLFKIDPEWRSKRDAARRKELAVGLLAYLTWTKEGEALLLATVIAAGGLGYILRSVLA